MKGLAFVKDPDGYWVELVARGTPGKILNTCNFSQTMLRVKDPQKSLEFYKKLGMRLLVEKHFDDFSLYFMGSSFVEDPATATPNPKEMFQPCLELTHNHGTESKEDFKHYCGNEDDRKGFGHIGFLVDNVYTACEEIGKLGYGFKKVGRRTKHPPQYLTKVTTYWSYAPSMILSLSDLMFDCVGARWWNYERSSVCVRSRWVLGGDCTPRWVGLW